MMRPVTEANWLVDFLPNVLDSLGTSFSLDEALHVGEASTCSFSAPRVVVPRALIQQLAFRFVSERTEHLGPRARRPRGRARRAWTKRKAGRRSRRPDSATSLENFEYHAAKNEQGLLEARIPHWPAPGSRWSTTPTRTSASCVEITPTREATGWRSRIMALAGLATGLRVAASVGDVVTVSARAARGRLA